MNDQAAVLRRLMERADSDSLDSGAEAAAPVETQQAIVNPRINLDSEAVNPERISPAERQTRLFADPEPLSHEATTPWFDGGHDADSHNSNSDQVQVDQVSTDGTESLSVRSDENIFRSEPAQHAPSLQSAPSTAHRSTKPRSLRPRTKTVLVLGTRSGVGVTTVVRGVSDSLTDAGDHVERANASDTMGHKPDRPNRNTDARRWRVVDGGVGFTASARKWWVVADHIVIVTSPDTNSLTGCYRLIKTAFERGLSLNAVDVLFNQVVDAAEAERLARRLEHSCERFLGHRLNQQDWIGFDVACASNVGNRFEQRTGTNPATEVNRRIRCWANRVLSGSPELKDTRAGD